MPLKASDIDKIILDACPDAKTKQIYLHHQFILKIVERLTYAFLISTLGGLAGALWDYLVV